MNRAMTKNLTHDNDYNGARIVRTTNVTYHGELHLTIEN